MRFPGLGILDNRMMRMGALGVTQKSAALRKSALGGDVAAIAKARSRGMRRMGVGGVAVGGSALYAHSSGLRARSSGGQGVYYS